MIAAGLLLIQSGTTSLQTTDDAVRIQLFVFTLGALLLVRGSVPMVRDRRWSARACRATGCVVDHVYLGGQRQPAAAPLVEFDAGGAHVRFVGTAGGRDRPPLGAPVTVLYDPADPGGARLADPKRAPSWWLIVGLVAVVAGIAGI